jgi:hypothetical protein
MKSGLLLSATASLMMLGSTAVFAQSYGSPAYAAPGAITLKPGQVQSVEPSSQPYGYAPPADTGIISLKPGQTVNTAASTPQDWGSIQGGATAVDPGFVTLKPGQAG